jgi:HAD superfamily hydrolase (TIGR01450 family)
VVKRNLAAGRKLLARISSQGETVARLVDGYDSLLLDLDGVVYLGSQAVSHAIESINAAQSQGLKIGYVTNNASRKPETIASQLADFGLMVQPDEVVGSARAAVKMLSERISMGAKVLVVGGEGLTSEVEAVGFEVVYAASDQPSAVIQGFSPEVGWKHLAEAAYAIQGGAIWIATNQDWTIPREGGIAPGNGTLVSAVHTAVGILPDFAGKPFRPIFESAISQLNISRPLMIGDRLDTDIRGGVAFGIDTACVLTGVASRKDLIGARAEDRPTYILEDLRQLFEPYPQVKATKRGVKLGKTEVELIGNKVFVTVGDPKSLEALRAACSLIWNCGTPIYGLDVEAALYE